MLSSRGEKVPLLGKGTPGQSNETPFRRRAAPQHISMEEDSYRVSPTKSDKADRRGPLGQLGTTLGDNFRKGVFKLVPPSNDPNTYEDLTNEEPWRWSFGTREDDGVWLNVHDRLGTVMACLVWVLIIYCGFTFLLLARHHHLPIGITVVHFTICTLALASHAKTTLTDPGAVPNGAVPRMTNAGHKFHSMCGVCQSYKPKNTHHCRICNRCISGMDHHCPWMNNCIGNGNMKHFMLFLAYTWTGSVLSLILFAVNYFFCSDEHCEFSGVEIHLVRTMSWICVATALFTSSMLTNVIFGIITGVGTIDRMKKKATNTWNDTTEDPIPLTNVFGIGPKVTWCLPVDPLFDGFDEIMGYATTQQLLRTQRQLEMTTEQVHQDKRNIREMLSTYNEVDV